MTRDRDDIDIIDIEAARKRLADLDIRTRGTHRHCAHWHISVYEDSRTVECRDCETVIDPVDVILRFARKEMSLRQFEDRSEQRARIDALEKQERNAKERLRKAQRKEAASKGDVMRIIDKALTYACQRRTASDRYRDIELFVRRVRAELVELFGWEAEG